MCDLYLGSILSSTFNRDTENYTVPEKKEVAEGENFPCLSELSVSSVENTNENACNYPPIGPPA